MHVTFTRVRTGDEPMESAAIFGDELQRWLRDIEGFHGLLILSREGESIGLTFWESREVAERHRGVRMEFLDRMTAAAAVEVEEVVDYEVSFAEVGPLLIALGSGRR